MLLACPILLPLSTAIALQLLPQRTKLLRVVAFAGALLAQYQGFADVQMGIGMIVWGLASVIIGRALIGSDSVGFALAGTILGSVLFRLIIAVALRWGLNPNDLKLVTALFVFGALVLPAVMQRVRRHAAAS